MTMAQFHTYLQGQPNGFFWYLSENQDGFSPGKTIRARFRFPRLSVHPDHRIVELQSDRPEEYTLFFSNICQIFVEEGQDLGTYITLVSNDRTSDADVRYLILFQEEEWS